uniref:KH_dom_type_1 domain-containing protein n=1 Tax=Macrostomum lignano TaxID=282301 RepID=A0A1I8J5L6_9PLAT
MGRLAGSDRPLTMRERARLEEIEMLEAELAELGDALPNARRLLELEIHRLRWGVTDMIDLLNNRKCKIRSKVLIPQDQYPGFNFVGKLLGQGGASLKKLQEETDVKMSILGAGSMRNELKEQECLNTGEAKFQHLKQTLHLQIDCLAEPTEAYYRISHALSKVKEAMTPDPNELAQYYSNQMQQFNVGPGVPQPPAPFPVMGAGGGRGGRGGGGGGHFGMPIGAMGGPGGPAGGGYAGGPMGGGMRGRGGMRGA